MFANPEVPLEQLPRAGDVEWQPLHAQYVRVRQITSGSVMLLIAAAWLAINLLRGGLPFSAWPLFVAAGLLAALVLSWPLVAVPRCGYALRAHDMLYRQGVLLRKVTAVPFNRIQHVEVSSGPLDRRFGIATLKLFTAGGSGGDLSVSGLPFATAERLRDFIQAEAGSVVESG